MRNDATQQHIKLTAPLMDENFNFRHKKTMSHDVFIYLGAFDPAYLDIVVGLMNYAI